MSFDKMTELMLRWLFILTFFFPTVTSPDYPFLTDGRADDKAKKAAEIKGKMAHDSTREAYLICQGQGMTKAEEHYE